jgi:alanyl-tRNA synthetase
MNELTYVDIRRKYLDFMKREGHVEIPSAPMIPEDDPSMLFIGAGMVPLVPYLSGETHPDGTRLTNSQRCLRTVDIDVVGDTAHCTTFEMLGNWSLNDYYKEEALRFTMDFFQKELNIDINYLYVSIFVGNKNAPKDEDSIRVWTDIFSQNGIQAEVGQNKRIQPYDDKCWWELEVGGPCGPCSEIFYDTGIKPCGQHCHVNCECGKYLELGNNVFMEYLKKGSDYTPLGRHNVDFGGGLDRLAAISQKKGSVFETDIYVPLFNAVQALAPGGNITSLRIITDHIKAATWIICDGIVPGRTEQGYILRRIIRRAIRHAKTIGVDTMFTRGIATIAIDQFAPIFPSLSEKKAEIVNIVEDEERKFHNTLTDGSKQFERLVKEKGSITGEDAFHLYETYGFPIEVTQEMLKERGLSLDSKEYEQSYRAHKEKSRTAAKGFFKGGLSDTSEMSKRYHTATHLLNRALRIVLGDHVYQKGSNISPERLRFDFPSDRKLTDEEIKKVEDIVNEQIERGLVVSWKEMPKGEALKVVPKAVFLEKYGGTVKVYSIGDGDNLFSQEICGGPHVNNTSELGTFTITKQESVAAGVKRIKAILT